MRFFGDLWHFLGSKDYLGFWDFFTTYKIFKTLVGNEINWIYGIFLRLF